MTTTTNFAVLSVVANFRAALRFTEDDAGNKVDNFNSAFAYLTHDAEGNEIADEIAKCQKSLKTTEAVIKRAPVELKFNVPTLAAFGIVAEHKVETAGITYADKSLQPLQDAIIKTVYDEARALLEAGEPVEKALELDYYVIANTEQQSRRSAKVAAAKISRQDNNAAVAAFVAWLEAQGKPKAGIDMQATLLKTRCRTALQVKKSTLERIIANIVAWLETVAATGDEELVAKVGPAAQAWVSALDEALNTDTDDIV